MVADDGTAGVAIADPEWRWLYHPYDSGADVIVESTARRDDLRRQHTSWLSSHPLGL
jgi:hypothetical protein